MKNIFKRLLLGTLTLSVMVSSVSVCAEPDGETLSSEEDTAVVYESEDTALLAEGAEVKKLYNGSETITLASKPMYGLTFEYNVLNAPLKSADDAVFKYTGYYDATGWGFKDYNHGQNGFNLDGTTIKAIKTQKMIFEFDVLPLYDGNGISMRYAPNGGTNFTPGEKTNDNVAIYTAGNQLKAGEWSKLTYVIGNTADDKSFEIYVNGELNASGTAPGYGSTGSNHRIYVHADGSKSADYEIYVDNIKIIAADSYEGYCENASLTSNDEHITVDEENKTIYGIDYGTTASELIGKLETDGVNIFAGDANGRGIAEDAVIENDYRVAAVSADGIYTYYKTAVKYVPGDIYKKVILKKNSLNEVTVKNIGEISNASLVVYNTEDGIVTGNAKVIHFDGSRFEVTIPLDTAASSLDNIKALLISNPENFASSVPVDGNSVKVEIAVESGVTASGSAEAESPVTFIVLKPNAMLDPSALTADGDIADIYYAGSVNTGLAEGEASQGSFVFDTVGFKSSGIYTYLVYKDGVLYEKQEFAPGTQAIINFKNGLKSVENENDLKVILDNDSKLGDTGLVYDYYKVLSDTEKTEICADIIAEMNICGEDDVNLDVFGDNLKYRTMIPAMVRKTEDNPQPAETVFNLLDTDNEIFNLSGSATDTYRTMTDADKKLVCAYICAVSDTVKNPETLQNALDIAVVNTKLDAIYTHADVYTALKQHSDVLAKEENEESKKLDYNKYALLTSEQKTVNMALYNGRPYKSCDELVSTANKLINTAYTEENKPKESSSKGGSGGSSSGGKNVTSSVPLSSIDSNNTGINNKPSGTVFSDLHSVEWAQEAINVLNKKGIISGKGNGVFDPNGTVTREEFVKMIVETAQLDTSSVSNTFADVKDDDWFSKYVCAAAQNGITSGIGNGNFGVGQSITRQDMMVMCMYLIPEGAAEGNIEKYSDSAEVADYAVKAVSTLTELGIVDGDGGKIMPTEKCTRAQAAKVIYMILKYNNKN